MRCFALAFALLLGCSDSGGSGKRCEGKCGGEALDWGVNDVSVLFAKPKLGGADDLIGMADGAGSARGPVLPEKLFERLGQDVMYLTESPDRDQHYAHLRVVAARFDPCFEQRKPDANCRRAVRLVAQPYWEQLDGRGKPTSSELFDASIHLFYELDDEAFVSLLLGTKDLVGEMAVAGPLDVHPIMGRQGLGEFSEKLNALLRERVGEENLVRMTFMATGRSGQNWFWGGFDRKASGEFALAEIPSAQGTNDSFEIPPYDPPKLPQNDDFPYALLYESYVDAMTEDELVEAARAVYRIEDPKVTDSTNIRCSHCHLASRSLDIAFKRRGLELPEDTEYTPPPGQNVELSDETRYEQRSMHGFSYFGGHAAISRRAVKDSAEAAGFISSADFTETLSPDARDVWRAPR